VEKSRRFLRRPLHWGSIAGGDHPIGKKPTSNGKKNCKEEELYAAEIVIMAPFFKRGIRKYVEEVMKSARGYKRGPLECNYGPQRYGNNSFTRKEKEFEKELKIGKVDKGEVIG